MVERCNVSERDQGDSFDNGVDWAAFGELANEARLPKRHVRPVSIILRVVASSPMPILRQTRRALRWESALVSGGLYRELHSYITMKSQLRACQLRDSGPGNAHDPGSIVNGIGLRRVVNERLRGIEQQRLPGHQWRLVLQPLLV